MTRHLQSQLEDVDVWKYLAGPLRLNWQCFVWSLCEDPLPCYLLVHAGNDFIKMTNKYFELQKIICIYNCCSVATIILRGFAVLQFCTSEELTTDNCSRVVAVWHFCYWSISGQERKHRGNVQYGDVQSYPLLTLPYKQTYIHKDIVSEL